MLNIFYVAHSMRQHVSKFPQLLRNCLLSLALCLLQNALFSVRVNQALVNWWRRLRVKGRNTTARSIRMPHCTIVNWLDCYSVSRCTEMCDASGEMGLNLWNLVESREITALLLLALIITHISEVDLGLRYLGMYTSTSWLVSGNLPKASEVGFWGNKYLRGVM